MQEAANGPAGSAVSQQVIMLGYYRNVATVSYAFQFPFWGV